MRQVLQPKLQQAATAGQLGALLQIYSASPREMIKTIGQGIGFLAMGALGGVVFKAIVGGTDQSAP
jgi:hypothetical protein